MGINLGAFIAPLVCGYLGQRVSWHLGFAAAGVGMLFGLAQYVRGAKYLGDAGLHPAPASPAAAAALKWRVQIWGGATLTALLVAAGAAMTGALPVTARQVADAAGYLLLAITVVFFAWMFLAAEWTRAERRRLYAIGLLFIAACLFWSEFEQAGSTLNLFGDRATRNSFLGWDFPSSYYQALQPLFIISFAPVFAWIWVKLGRHEPSSPSKFGIGLLFVGGGFAVLVAAANIAATGAKVSPSWLVVTYLLHSFGELALSPVGMSATTRLAPARVTGLMMGVFYLAISVGNFMGGRLSSLYESMALPSLFGAIAVAGLLGGVVMLLLARPIERLTITPENS
jgi:POT family proton-dependent oligopeptide transporter